MRIAPDLATKLYPASKCTEMPSSDVHMEKGNARTTPKKVSPQLDWKLTPAMPVNFAPRCGIIGELTTTRPFGAIGPETW